jgi:hypothetical protein
MDDSADEAVPEADAARGRPPVANVLAGSARGRDSQREPDPFHRLVPFKKAGAGSAQQPLSWFEQLFAYGSHAALAACLFGFAWAAGSYFSGGHPPFSPLKPPITRTIAPQDSAERIELLRMAQKMAEDIRALKVDVEALRAAQSLTAKDTAGIAGLKTRLDAVKTETGTSIAELAGKVERMQREPEAKLSQIIQRLDRMEGQLATPLAAGSSGAAPAPPKAVSGKPVHVAEAKPPINATNGQRNPQLITNWVVRDVYDGIALVESPRGSIEVTPGETIPGAGTVKSIERRGTGWIVITNLGLVDSARDSFQP